MKNISIVLGLLVLAASPAVHAQDGSAYYGVSLGEFDYSESGDLVDDTVSSTCGGSCRAIGAPLKR